MTLTSSADEIVKSKVIILLFETLRLLIIISPRNLYNSLKSINEIINKHNSSRVIKNKTTTTFIIPENCKHLEDRYFNLNTYGIKVKHSFRPFDHKPLNQAPRL